MIGFKSVFLEVVLIVKVYLTDYCAMFVTVISIVDVESFAKSSLVNVPDTLLAKVLKTFYSFCEGLASLLFHSTFAAMKAPKPEV